MTHSILELDLGQVNVYQPNTATTYSRVVKTIGLIQDNRSKLDTPIQLTNRPQNNFFNVIKTGNTREYVLILSFEKI